MSKISEDLRAALHHISPFTEGGYRYIKLLRQHADTIERVEQEMRAQAATKFPQWSQTIKWADAISGDAR